MTWRETRPNEYIRYDVARSYLHNACQYIGSNGGLELKCRFDHEKTTTVPQWIPCSERMPRIEENPVLVSWMGLVNIGWYNPIDGWTTGTRFNVDEVIAWMPLPEPYKEGRNESNIEIKASNHRI